MCIDAEAGNVMCSHCRGFHPIASQAEGTVGFERVPSTVLGYRSNDQVLFKDA
jgi:hypothetical protein